MTKGRTKRRLFQQPKKVVERFVRLWMRRKGASIGHAIGRRNARRSLTRSEKHRSTVLAQTLDIVAREAIRSRRLKLRSSEAVLNLGLFFLVAERDIQAAKIDALTHPDAWMRSLAARVILLTIYELDLDKAGGVRLRRALLDADVPAEVQKELAGAMRTIRAAQQKAQKQFEHLRHSTIAHRDSDAILQYRSIKQIDGLKVVRTSVEFYKGVHAFMAVMPKVLSHVSSTHGVIAQLVAQMQRDDPLLADLHGRSPID